MAGSRKNKEVQCEQSKWRKEKQRQRGNRIPHPVGLLDNFKDHHSSELLKEAIEGFSAER